jgi:hypothetical protein
MRKGDDALTAKQWGIVIDTTKMDHEKVEHIIEACHSIHNVPDISAEKVGEKVAKRHEIKWIWETHFHNAFTNLPSKYMSEAVEESALPGALQPLRRSPLRSGLPHPGDVQAARRHRAHGFSPLHRLPFLYGGLPLWLAQL